MSQEKVDRYKKEKANRAQIQKKEKRMLFLEKFAIGAVGLLAAVWIGYSAYGVVSKANSPENKEPVTTEMDMEALSGYLQGLTKEAE